VARSLVQTFAQLLPGRPEASRAQVPNSAQRWLEAHAAAALWARRCSDSRPLLSDVKGVE
jgi:hypothetical protein